jgi:hypothetical protein
MGLSRRTFLLAGIASAAALSTEGLRVIARTLSAPPAAAKVASAVAASPYGNSVRAQVFEVIVRQAQAGAPWLMICDGPMRVNNITPQEVEEELERRAKFTSSHPSHEHGDEKSCMVCIREYKHRLVTEHPSHTETIWACNACVAELVDKAHRQHQQHGEYTDGCHRCRIEALISKYRG